MAFRFRLHEPITKDFRRIGTEQIERAIAQLSAGDDVPKEVHEARKCLKRLRALLRLGREGLGKEVFQAENARFRTIAGRLSSVRDDHVVIETLVGLEATTDDDEVRSALRRARAAFLDAHAAEDATAGHAVDPATLAEVQAELAGALESFRDLKLNPKGTPTLVAGLVRIYRRGRKGLVTAYATGHDEDFHTLRKAVQAHWRHMGLLTRLWPEMFSARVEAARELSQILGDDHDLALLKTRIAALGADTLADDEKGSLLALISDRQGMLRRLAEPRGEMLFAASPKAHGQWITALWDAAIVKAKIDTEAEKAGFGRPASSKKQTFSRS